MPDDNRGPEIPSMTATEVRSRWSECLALAADAGAVLVTRYGRAHVVITSVEHYAALVRGANAAEPAENPLPSSSGN